MTDALIYLSKNINLLLILLFLGTIWCGYRIIQFNQFQKGHLENVQKARAMEVKGQHTCRLAHIKQGTLQLRKFDLCLLIAIGVLFTLFVIALLSPILK